MRRRARDSALLMLLTAVSAASATTLTQELTPTTVQGVSRALAARSDAGSSSTPQMSDFRDPFYASTFPQCYALSATTVISYTLVIMLLITPRSFLDGGVVVLGRRGFTNGGTGGKNIGGRPWLQKVAALTVAISLTIATVDTFRVAEIQYSWGVQNAKEIHTEVMDGTELKVIRLISDFFLWLAQAQTLIRLFPRQREKIIIKWTAFSLVTLNLIFDSLNSFLYKSSAARTFTDAIPALSYLFQLALGVLYAAWVIYYSLMKKRYAFYHPQMRNISLVAVLSLLAILVPIVFFVLDISKPDFTAWGDYVRWVGAAAASVIVWEWVERIEALEREEKKDGILGREVFDGDEVLDIMPSDFSWPRRRRKNKQGDKGDDESVELRRLPPPKTTQPAGRFQAWPAFASRYLPPGRRHAAARSADASRRRSGDNTNSNTAPNTTATARRLQPPLWPARPAPAATPVSRTDTASADSTIYVMRYHPVGDPSALHTTHEAHPSGSSSVSAGLGQALSRSSSSASTSSRGRGAQTAASSQQPWQPNDDRGAAAANAEAGAALAGDVASSVTATATTDTSARRWRVLAHALPFRRDTGSRSDDSEAGLSQAARESGGRTREAESMQHDETSLWDFRTRLEEFAAMQAEKLRERIRPSIDTTGLPVMVIPAPKRQGVLARVLEEEESQQQQQQQRQEQQQQRQEQQQHPPAQLPVLGQLQRSGSNASASTNRSAEAVSVLWRNSSEGSVSSGARPASGPGPTSREGPPAVVAAALSRAGSGRV